MKRNEQHLAAALERLVGAAESFSTLKCAGGHIAAPEWRRDYGFTLALEAARRALVRHRGSSGSHRAPAEVLLAIRERRKATRENA
jgi:hypothetical protein